MNVLSLFDGMSCGQIALNKAGISYEKYYASEIDKHAIKVTQANYPQTIQLGDVTKWKEWDLDWSKIGLLLAGSPCQGFSFAGKQLAFDDPRSALFFVFVEIWRHIKKHNPNAKYLLENVKMKHEHELVISQYMNVHPIEINSALLTAQNRVRLYWTNISNEPYGLFGDMACTIPQPKDKGILLKDVLESDVNEKYYLKSDKIIDFITDQWRLDKKYTQINGDKAITQQARQYSSWCGDYITACIKFGRTEEAKKIRKENMAKGKDYSPFAEKEIVGLDFEKMNTLTTAINKDNYVMGFDYRSDEGIRPRKDNKSPTILARAREDIYGVGGVIDNYNIRRLTPVECERLQSVPDNYTAHVSDSQRYKMLGNGWTVDVIVHILKYL
jgi:DNA-cytosine methyltransferase